MPPNKNSASQLMVWICSLARGSNPLIQTTNLTPYLNKLDTDPISSAMEGHHWKAALVARVKRKEGGEWIPIKPILLEF